MITLLKQSLIAVLLLSPSMTYTLEAPAPLLTITLANQVNFEFVHQCCNQAEELKEILQRLLHELSEDMDYWNLQQLTTFSYFISKGPAAWFTDKAQEQELYEKIVFLKKALEKNAYYLGRIHYYLIKNYHAESAYDIEKYMRELLSLVHSCVSPEHAQPYDIVLPYQETSQQQWSQLLVSNQKNLNTFYYRMCDAYQGYKKPNHFRRNWLAYSALTASTVALAVYAFRNQKNIKEWYAKATTALDNYWHSHVHDPIANSVDILTDNSQYMESSPVDDQTVEIEREARNDRIRAYRKHLNQNEEAKGIWGGTWYYLRKMRDYLFTRNHISGTVSEYDIEKEIEDANNGHIPQVIHDRNEYMKNPIKNTLYGELPQTLEIEVLHAKTQVTELVNNGIKTYNLMVKNLRSNQLIIELFALVPTFIIGKLVYNASKETLHYINKRNILPLKNCTRLIHRTLNKYTNADEILPMDLGFVVFWISELKKQVTNLPKHDQCSFMEDLDDLLKAALTIEQKRAVIHRMYGTYNFLTPS